MISFGSRIGIGSFTASADVCVIRRDRMRVSNPMRDREYRAASYGKADEEKQHFYGSPGE